MFVYKPFNTEIIQNGKHKILKPSDSSATRHS